MNEQYMNVKDAREALRISKVAMAALLRYGILPWEPDPSDARVKLVPVSAIRAYQREQEQHRKQRTGPKAIQVA